MTSTIRVKPRVWWESEFGPVVIKEQIWDPLAEEWRITLEYKDAGMSEFMTDPAPGTGRRYGPPRSGPGLVRTLDDSLRLERGRHYRYPGATTPGDLYEIHCPDGRWRQFTRITNFSNLFLPEGHPLGRLEIGGVTLAQDVKWLWDKFIGHAVLCLAKGDPRKAGLEAGSWFSIGIYVLGDPSNYGNLIGSRSDADESYADRLEELRLLPCYETAAIMEAIRDRIRQAVIQSTPRDCWVLPEGPSITVDDEEYVWSGNMDDPFDPHNQEKWRIEFPGSNSRLALAARIQFQLLHFIGPASDVGGKHAVGVYVKRGERYLRTCGYTHAASAHTLCDKPFDVDLSLADDLPRSQTMVRYLNQ